MIDTDNDSLVAVQGDEILIMRPRQRMNKAKALNLAAWLVALADDEDEFIDLLMRVKNT